MSREITCFMKISDLTFCDNENFCTEDLMLLYTQSGLFEGLLFSTRFVRCLSYQRADLDGIISMGPRLDHRVSSDRESRELAGNICSREIAGK